ncbi:MAG: IMP dehydrogenase [Nitrososphaerales archaeon]
MSWSSANGMRIGLTFDDVLLVPKRSDVLSRKNIDLRTKLSRRIELNVPLISANMDTVTESAMAISMARLGGIGIIHRFMSIQQQVSEVSKVKRSEGILIEQPVTISLEMGVSAARHLMHTHEIGGILVTAQDNKLLGIVTRRDIFLEDKVDETSETDGDTKVEDIMTRDLVTAPPGTSIAEAKTILKKNKVEKLPIIDGEGRVVGLITSKDIVKMRDFPYASKDPKGRLRVGAAIGVKDDSIERAGALADSGVDVIVVDIAHGHSDLAINTVSKIRDRLGEIEIIAGNVATAEGTRDLIEAGVDGVKVGVGAGSICITREITGAGVPQLSAIMDCAVGASDSALPIVADGGIRNSGDLVKALAAGASTVMVGGILAGTDESPGITVVRPNGRYKMSRGMASLGAALDRSTKETRFFNEGDVLDYVPEGVEGLVPYKGRSQEVVSRLIGGLRSGMSYSGARTLEELRKNATFIGITTAGQIESRSHDVQPLEQ